MPKFDISKIKHSFSKEGRQQRAESYYNKQLVKARSKYERYAAQNTEQARIDKLKSELASYKQMRNVGKKKRKVRIGGYTFKI